MNILVGKILQELYISEDKQVLKFVTTEGDIFAVTEADCCSHTWIEHIEVFWSGLSTPVKVLEVMDLNLNERYNDGEPDPDGHWTGLGNYLKFYGCRIIMENHKQITLDYRNESNGYYGGNLEWCIELPEHLEEDCKWIKVEKDI